MFRRRSTNRHRAPDFSTGVTIRYAFPDDAEAVRRLAVTDSRSVPGGPLLLAEIGGELWAAVSLRPPHLAVADPFRPTAELVLMLRERARRLAPQADDARSGMNEILPSVSSTAHAT